MLSPPVTSSVVSDVPATGVTPAHASKVQVAEHPSPLA